MAYLRVKNGLHNKIVKIIVAFFKKGMTKKCRNVKDIKKICQTGRKSDKMT